MNAEELKNIIGSQAESIIVNDLGLNQISPHIYHCCITEHRKGNQNAPMEFYQDGYNFHCHDCKQNYDILDHAGKKYQGVEFFAYLKQLAGVIDDKPVKQKKQVQMKKETVQKYNANFSGLEQMQVRGTFDNPAMLQYIDERCISERVAKLFYLSGDNEAVYFNYWVNNNNSLELARIKGRRLGKVENGKNKYLPIAGGSQILYGSHLYQGQGVLIICEGEFDALSMTEGIYHINAQSHAMAVSVPSGTGHKWIEQCEPFLKQFKTIVVCPDIDEAGIKFREVCFEKMEGYDIQWIDLEVFLNKNKHNDLNALLVTQGRKAVSNLLKHIEKPYHSCGMLAKKIQRSKKKEMFFTGFYGLDRACKFKFGELAVLAGESNDGKTTIMRQMMIFAVRNGLKLGCVFGEETDDKFMDLTIRQAYQGDDVFESQMDEFGDNQYIPKFEVEDQFKREFGDAINLFQLDRVRDIEKIGDKILDWISHCADIEGRKVFLVDNLMKVTADEESDEYVAQAKFTEKLYRLAQKKSVFIMMVVHTKKITGIIDQNSIHGTKKIYNTPDYVLFFQRMDRFKQTKELTRDMAMKSIRYQARLPEHTEFTSFMWAHKIRDRNPSYKSDLHAMEYDFKTTCSTELLTSYHGNKIHKDGWSRFTNQVAQADQPQPL